MINYIGKTQIKKWLVEDLKSFLKQYGFKITPSVNVDIKKDDEEIIFDTFFGVSLTDDIGLSHANIRYKKVEETLFKVTGLPVYSIGSRTISVFSGEKFGILATLAKNRNDVTNISESFKQVFIECFLPAFEKYSDPKNVLELWDSLETSKEKGKYFQDSNNYSKILILSKMSNDLRYEQRIKESIEFYENKIRNGEEYYKEELGYCEKVIEYLANNEI
ncbi:hypothetical protein [Cellulophaga sp. BC115SP]|uniref:hypothetical protein n=1 Tax=Cellulophaga sp. BC115SP TaxID=2683263 RepID=UPI0014135B32|nr:hypothetical protein [Cellulophaga sp. BC115SP]NBB31992.1 hypothetical protein [Cellulophaga sp. BC115SP]